MTTTTGKLTPKQRQVYGLLRQGRSPTDIAKRLHTTSSNIHGHIRRMRDAGVEIPAADVAASNERSLGATNGSGPEDRARQALMEAQEEAKARVIEIDERCGEMQREVDRLRAEREVLDARSDHYSKALAELNA